MIDYLNTIREMIMTCDNCDDESTFYGSWQACIEEAKEEGWKMRKDETNNWTHMCPMCVAGRQLKHKKPEDVFPEIE